MPGKEVGQSPLLAFHACPYVRGKESLLQAIQGKFLRRSPLFVSLFGQSTLKSTCDCDLHGFTLHRLLVRNGLMGRNYAPLPDATGEVAVSHP